MATVAGECSNGLSPRFRLTQTVAANSMSHNPPAPGLLSITDALGVLVLDENRQFQTAPQFVEDFRALVTRDHNHPSVLMWDVCNEGECGNAAAGPLFRQVATAEDGTRPLLANMVNNQPSGPLANETDVIGFSHAPLSTVAAFHEQHPTRPMFMSECCSCNSQRGENECRGKGCDGGGNQQAHDATAIESSFNANCVAGQVNVSNGVPWMSGTMVWTLMDCTLPSPLVCARLPSR